MNPIQQAVSEIVREVALKLHENIVRRTPIDTGRAKSSWNISENFPDESVTPVLRDTILEQKAKGAEVLTIDNAHVAALTSQQNISQFPTVVFISNALPYIENLERGSSKQAPLGMVRISVTENEIIHLIDNAIAKVNP